MPTCTPRWSERRPRLRRLMAAALLALLALTMLPLSAVAAPQAQGNPNIRIRILPIGRARFVPGQRFDFRVEVSGDIADNTPASALDVRINGQPAAQLLGRAGEGSNASPRSVELTWRQVALNTPGVYTVTVNAGGVVRSASWEIVNVQAPSRRAKNVILLIADGMTSETITLGRIVSKGLTEGKFNGVLTMDTMPEYGYISTSGYDSLVTDSANSASAYSTGQKGVVNSMGIYADNTSDPNDDPRVENVVEYLNRTRNMAIGVVSTAEVEDATPAAMWSHTRRRAQYEPILDQLFDDPTRQIDVLMGGGSAYFIPKSTPGSRRTDERDILGQFSSAGYSIAATRAELNNAPNNARLLGLFHPSNMNVYIDREQTRDPEVLGPYTDQPTLVEMTAKAINVLTTLPDGSRNGFFLMVEAGSVDKQLHPMDWERAIGDLIEFDKAVKVALDFAARNNDTLVVVTADHGHSVSVFGSYDTTKGPGNRDAVGTYELSRFPTYQDANGDGFPDSWTPSVVPAVGFGNRPDYYDDFLFNPRPLSPTIQDRNAPQGTTAYVPNPARDPNGILLSGNLPRSASTEVHSADDIPLYASGPGSAYFNGFHDNTDVFFGIMTALGAGTPTRAQGFDPLALGGLVIGLTVVAGASRYLRRPGSAGVGPVAYSVERLTRLGPALGAAVRSFREAMRAPRR